MNSQRFTYASGNSLPLVFSDGKIQLFGLLVVVHDDDLQLVAVDCMKLCLPTKKKHDKKPINKSLN